MNAFKEKIKPIQNELYQWVVVFGHEQFENENHYIKQFLVRLLCTSAELAVLTIPNKQ